MHLAGKRRVTISANLHGLKLKQFGDVLLCVCVCVHLFPFHDSWSVLYVIMPFQLKRLLRAANELRRCSWMGRMWQLEWSGYGLFEGIALVFMWRDWGKPQKPDSGKLVSWLTFVQSYWACFGLYPSSCMWKTKNPTTSDWD
jgi:hypothetical protein